MFLIDRARQMPVRRCGRRHVAEESLQDVGRPTLISAPLASATTPAKHFSGNDCSEDERLNRIRSIDCVGLGESDVNHPDRQADRSTPS